MTEFSELKTKTGASGSSCIRRRIACCRGRNEGVNCRSDNRKGIILCAGQKSREGIQLHLQGWHDETVDVPWIFSIERIGKLDAFSSHLNGKSSPIYKGCFTLSIRDESIDTLELQICICSIRWYG